MGETPHATRPHGEFEPQDLFLGRRYPAATMMFDDAVARIDHNFHRDTRGGIT